jgi:hypothetical protein
MIFRRKSEKEKLRRATLRGFYAAEKQLKEQHREEIKFLKQSYIEKLKEKSNELRKLEKKVKKIEQRAKWLNEFEHRLYEQCQKASKSSYLDLVEMTRNFNMIDRTINQIEQRQNSNNRHKEKMQDAIAEYEIEKIKVSK